MTASVDPTRAITEEEPCEFFLFLFSFFPLLFPFSTISGAQLRTENLLTFSKSRLINQNKQLTFVPLDLRTSTEIP